MNTICLNMIVKNESKIIERLLKSVLPIIDSYCICDTGSTDNTIEIIQTFFANHNIPGKIVQEPFINFCHNRNFALKSCIGMSDFVLLLDADMILNVNGFDKIMLTGHDSCYILQGTDNFYYKNMRIVRNNGEYSYSGVTHEYINTPLSNRLLQIDKNALFIHDIGDGGSKHDKFERDIKLLLEGIKEDCNNVRYHFYLANSYHDSNQLDKAIEMYEKRITLKGWEQEVWYSYYKIGVCYKKQGKMPEAIYAWLNAYEYMQTRIENLYEIINHYRIIGKCKLAKYFYDLAIDVLSKNQKDNKNNFLFLHNDVYTYKIFYEYTILAYHVGVKNINDEIIKVFNNCSYSNITNNLLSNMKFYKDILTPINVIKLDHEIDIEINNELIHFNSSSSCIIQAPNFDNNKYLMNVRYVNYLITEKGSYLNCDKHIITCNKYVELDKEFNINFTKMVDTLFDNRRYCGIEDIRIFNDVQTNDLLFIGTGYHTNNTIGIVSGVYNIYQNGLSGNELTQQIKKTQTSCEKNWVYVNYQNSTHIIYKWSPLQIGKLDESFNLQLVATKETPKIFELCRGSTCGCLYKSNIWFIQHIVSYESPRHYYHIISVFDTSMELLRYSAPFKFEGECIEYCIGLIVEDDRVIINYSTWNRTTRIGVYDKKYIDLMVKYV